MLKVSIKTTNAAFADESLGHELARILRKLAERLEAGTEGAGALADINGNRVGEWKLTGRRGA